MATAEQYRDTLLKLLPRGRAWPRDSDSWLFKFAHAIGGELSRADGRVRDLLREIDPRTAVELLPEYEREYGLPDECSSLGNSVEERRADIIARMAAYGGQAADYFVDVLTASGVPITVSYLGPTRVGATSGSRLRSPGYRHVWFVDVPSTTPVYATMGASVAGDYLIDVGNAGNVICFIEKNKPAHTIINYTFS